MLHFNCSRNVVCHLTRQSRKGRTGVLLCSCCTEAAPAHFGDLIAKQTETQWGQRSSS